MEHTAASDRYVVISSDCHAGADLRDYKPYLESKWNNEFDAWARVLRLVGGHRHRIGVEGGRFVVHVTPQLGRAASLYGADMDLLQTVAERIGPPIDEVKTLLQPDELPDDPNFLFIIEHDAGLSSMVGTKSSS